MVFLSSRFYGEARAFIFGLDCLLLLGALSMETAAEKVPKWSQDELSSWFSTPILYPMTTWEENTYMTIASGLLVVSMLV